MTDAFEKEGERKAGEYLEAQKHFYKQLSDQKKELRRFQESRAEHQQAISMLKELPEKV